MPHESINLFHALLGATKSAVKTIWASEELAGLTGPQFGLLKSLHHRGAMTPGELAEILVVSAGNITGLIERLRKQGLVERRRLASDRRCLRIDLTPAGRAKLDAITPVWEKAVKSCFKPLSPIERKQLTDLLNRLHGLLPGGPHCCHTKDSKESGS
ncbi:MAG: winged helix-turn-helix transcriptional regulator [Candidatus Riflebacteria bacterium]|nr:winged helix-turn-helix transcriptional regulator [Candidatus Riflebacteria bacterium]